MRNWQPLQVHDLLLLGSVGLLLFSQQFFLVQALRYINAGLLSPMSYFTIVFAGVFGWLLWSETDMRTFLGVALVLFSGVLTLLTGRKQEAAARRPQTRQIVRWSGPRPCQPTRATTDSGGQFRYAWKSDLIDDGWVRNLVHTSDEPHPHRMGD